ncbi:MAG: hypothetical protein WC797_01240 [Candidatus Paceibacterota bacterium]|jgi:hypothetical protein
MKLSENPNFHTVELQQKTEKNLGISVHNLWKRFAELFRQKNRSSQELLTQLKKAGGEPEQDTLITEGEKTVELYNSSIGRVADEARIETASLTGESGRTVEQPPPITTEKICLVQLINHARGIYERNRAFTI